MSEATSHVEFDTAVANALGTDKSPAAWVRVAKVVRFRCTRCAGTGTHSRGTVYDIGGGSRPLGSCGACYRCNGTGEQDHADALRNQGYDRHSFSEACRDMFA